MSWYPGGSPDSDRLNPPSNRRWWHYGYKKYIPLKKNHAYRFYYFKVYRTRDEPVIIVDRPIIIENGVVYSKLFPSQWELYELKKDIRAGDVIFYEGNSKYKDCWIINDMVYKAKRVKPDYVKRKINGYEQISLFDL